MFDPSTSPFDTLETTFRLLATGLESLSLDGSLVGPPLPAREIPLSELRDLLLNQKTPHRARNRAIGLLLARAQAEHGTATIALAGVLLPGLRKVTYPLTRALFERAADVEAEALTGLLEAAERLEPDTPKLAWKLVAGGLHRADRLVSREITVGDRRAPVGLPDVPARPFGHPDLVLAEAVCDGVIGSEDAFVIGETRLGGVSLKEVARRLDIGVETLQKRRRRAEKPLVSWLETGYVRNRVPQTATRGAGQPRKGCRLTDIARTDRLTPKEVIHHPSGRPCASEADPSITSTRPRGGTRAAREKGHSDVRCTEKNKTRAGRSGRCGDRLGDRRRLVGADCDREHSSCRGDNPESERRDHQSP
ncbi:MAG: hypothetical protein ACYDGN_12165 [Acidimicrobiales bacterium]